MRNPEDEHDGGGHEPKRDPRGNLVLMLILIVSAITFLLAAFGVIELGGTGTFDCSVVGCGD